MEEREWGKGATTDRTDGLYSRFEIFAGRRRGCAAGVSSETSAKMDIGVPFIIARHGNLSGGAARRSAALIIACRRVRIIVRRNTINSYVSP